ncbi:hypothetical protein Q9R46_03245 [Paenibacillus sp. RRE4]|uniref:hypothetical protein n=1 Tax=Paenibacillus sp. RRE4 TaxID=2962587 RepID=UPI002881E923|nr:hypothetical protein [Paenibacillus sp. RRE4]MDT0121641.1 hypothetical protein [Paenibacillus sp. RRE4]
MKNEIVFRLKNMFIPGDKISEWILKLSLIRNDLFYIHRSLIDYLDGTKKHTNGEFIYYFRLAASHYREAAKFIVKNNFPQKDAFIDSLSDEAKYNYKLIIDSCTPWETSFVRRIVKPIRDSFFHYDNRDFEEEYRELPDFFTRVSSAGKKRKEIDFVYADELAINLIFKGKSEQEIIGILNELSEYLIGLICFVDDVVGRYFIQNESKQAYVVRSKNGY